MLRFTLLFAVLLINLKASGQYDFLHSIYWKALNDKALLRTLTDERWDSQTQSWAKEVTKFGYDQKGRRVYSKGVSRDPSSGQLETGESIRRYDDLDNLIYFERSSYIGDQLDLQQQRIETWKYQGKHLMKYEKKDLFDFGEWRHRWEIIYEYDQNGNKTSEIQIGYDQNDQELSKWEQRWVFDQYDCVTVMVEKYFDKDSVWHPDKGWSISWHHLRGDSSVFARNVNCQALEDYYYHWSYASFYHLGSKSEYELDDDGLVVRLRRYHRVSYEDEKLTLDLEKQYARDESGNILHELTTGANGPRSQIFNEFDDKDRKIYSFKQDYDPTEKLWVDRYKIYHTYDERDNLISYFDQSFDESGRLMQQHESNKEYNAEGELLNYLTQFNWDTVANHYNSFIEQTYEWNADQTLAKASVVEFIEEMELYDPDQTPHFSAEEVYEYRCDGSCIKMEFRVTEGYRTYYHNRKGEYDYYQIADCETFPEETLEITIFPNPTYRGLNVYNDSPLGTSIIQILNSEGRLVYNQKHHLSNYFSMDLFNLKSGLYFFQLTNNEKKFIGKFVKQ